MVYRALRGYPPKKIGNLKVSFFENSRPLFDISTIILFCVSQIFMLKALFDI